jgi:hypothetical protein
MKSLKLAVIVSVVMLSVSSLAQADGTERLNHNFMSKRAYQAPVENNNANKAVEEFEGATFRPAETANEEGFTTQNKRILKQLRINSFARRSFVG